MKKLNALTGQGFDHSETGLMVNSAPTMSSLQMVDYINADRNKKACSEGLDFPCKKFRMLKHNDFLKKVPKVLGENQSGKFFSDYIDGKGRAYPCYRFPKREACLMAMSYSHELQAAVYDYMEELDRQQSGYLNYTITELQNIVASARKSSDDDSSDAGRRLRKRQDDLVLLEKAEYLVSNLGQIHLPFIGGDQDAK